MDRKARLKRKARIWQVLGVLAFVIGALLIYGRIAYDLTDFYAEYHDVPEPALRAEYGLGPAQNALLDAALSKMEAQLYWEAMTDLEQLKQHGGKALELAEWYKILCLIGLERKEEAQAMLDYYVEQPSFTHKKAEALQLEKDY